MHLQFFDIAVIVCSLVSIVGIGFWVSARSGKSSSEFFLSGRNMPWWMLGLSMVATTFAADTPGLVAGWARDQGVVQNWTWWAFCLSGMLTVFVYARLWRRSGVLTDMEFYELRYSGKAASFLRGFRAVYLGLVFNAIVMAVVNLAAIKISASLFGISAIYTILVAALLTAIFSAVGGFRGVVISDILLFVMAIVGSVAAAYFVIGDPAVGGMTGLFSNKDVIEKASFLPDFSTESGWELAVMAFVIPLSVQWWAAWYPGAEPGGGGYVAQRMLAAKDENHAQWATLLFNATHYAVRPWPWILVGLASIVILPLDSKELQMESNEVLAQVMKGKTAGEIQSYVEQAEADGNVDDPVVKAFYGSKRLTTIRKEVDPSVLPAGQVAHDLSYSLVLRKVPSPWLGIIVASLLAAYISTISTHLNWGASYLVNDFYVKYLDPNASEKRKVWVGRFWTVLLMVLSVAISLVATSAGQMFQVIIAFGAGTGLIYLLRWFWWRINAWSEISAMIFSGIFALGLPFLAERFGEDWPLPSWSHIPVQVLLTTTIWMLATYLGPKTDAAVLMNFLKFVNPPKVGWGGFLSTLDQNEKAEIESLDGGGNQLAVGIFSALFASFAVYGTLFGTGFWLYQKYDLSASCFVATGVAIAILCFSGSLKSTKQSLR